jgi:hypothetical protein
MKDALAHLWITVGAPADRGGERSIESRKQPWSRALVVVDCPTVSAMVEAAHPQLRLAGRGAGTPIKE